MKKSLYSLLASAVLGLGLSATPATAEQDAGQFQIMKATADKVWRLNKNTGEIAVCSLDGERLVCTSSSEAIRPPAISYEEREAERKRQDADKRVRDMALLDRVLTAIRTFMDASSDHAGEEPK